MLKYLNGGILVMATLLPLSSFAVEECPFDVRVRDGSRYDDKPMRMKPFAAPIKVGDASSLEIRRIGNDFFRKWPFFYAYLETPGSQDTLMIDCPEKGWSGRLPCKPEVSGISLSSGQKAAVIHLVRSVKPLSPSKDLKRKSTEIQLASRSLGDHDDKPGMLKLVESAPLHPEEVEILTKSLTYGRSQSSAATVMAKQEQPSSPPAKKPLPEKRPGAVKPITDTVWCDYHLNFVTRSDPISLSNYAIHARRPTGYYRILQNGDTIRSGDLYKIKIKTEEKIWLYIFQMDSGGKVDWLFPKAKWNLVNPILPQHDYELPNTQEAMYFDDRTGSDRFYLVVSRQQDQELEKFVDSLVGNTSPSATKVAYQVHDFVNSRGLGGKMRDGEEGVVLREEPVKNQPVTFSVMENRLEQLCSGCFQLIELRHQ